jgi:hypothetical protein
MFAFQSYVVWNFVFPKLSSPVSPNVVSRRRFAWGEFPPNSARALFLRRRGRGICPLSEGAIDYLLKGFMDTSTLERVLRTALERLGDAQFAALAVDAAEPSATVLRQRVESRLAMHNQSRQPRGPLAMRVSVGYWGANDTRSFPEFLDAVESELRQPEAVLSQAATHHDTALERQ